MTTRVDTTRVRLQREALRPWAAVVAATPALAIDDQVVIAGRIPSVTELVDLIREAAR